MRHVLIALLTALTLAACNNAATRPSVDPAVYAAALAAPARYAKDLERDARRKPDQVSAFFGIAPGMQVLDMFTGGGYTTEYNAWLVGPSGRVTAYNPPAYDAFVKDELALRYTNGRLANVERLSQELPELTLAPARYDAVLMIQNYHDVYFVNEPSWKKVDAPAMLARIHAALKPGGVFGIVDHAAATGGGSSAAQTLHRIEKSKVIADLEAAGFVLEAESDLLANPADDHSKSVFAKEINGQTDQFVLRFRKPN